ncbi:transposase [Arthrobacter globiformis]|uniref:transposase n=1 Tax=Arthrobacter globiformis TaxID=1665 RepID=UPI003593A961
MTPENTGHNHACLPLDPCTVTAAAATVEHRITVLTLQSITARIRFLGSQLADIDPELARLIQEHPAGPALLAEPGVGPVVAAQLLISWSHPGRVRSEAAFASLAGVAPWKPAAANAPGIASTAAATGPDTQPSPAHDRDHAHQMPRRNPGLRSPANPSRQDPS